MFYEGEHVNESASWNDAALAALLHFLPAEHGQYACKGFTLPHWFPLLNVEDTGVESRLRRVRIAVDKLIGLQFADDGSFLAEGASSEEVLEAWRSVGFYAREFGIIACTSSDLDLKRVVKYVHAVLVRKQMDYGHENIRKFGRTGLIVRIQDKVARLENLVAKGSADDPQNESLLDNVVDVMGYSAIGIMWERGKFLLKLKTPETVS